jgi:hypothetical protein
LIRSHRFELFDRNDFTEELIAVEKLVAWFGRVMDHNFSPIEVPDWRFAVPPVSGTPKG